MNNALETALYGRLAGGTALTSLLAGTASIYNSLAPPGSAHDFVVFSHQGGGDENLTPRRMRNVVYLVKAVSTAGMAKAGQIDAAADALLHNQELSVSGWANFWLAREGDVRYSELTEDGKRYFHSGGLYRVRTDQ